MQEMVSMATFAEVVKQGSFTAAADALGVSKAYVSKQVAQLEASLGVSLLRRTTRRLHLTEEGERFLDYCRRSLATAQEGFQLLRSRSHEVSGRLRISAPITFGQVFLPQLVHRYQQRFPAVEVDLVLENRKVDLLEENYDLAVRITETPPQGYALTALGEMEDIVCASPAYLARQGTPRTPPELAQHECLIYLNPGRALHWIFRRQRQVQVVEVQGRLATNHHQPLIAALLSGSGIGKLPDYCVRDDLAAGRLVRLFPQYRCDRIPVYLVHPQLAGQPPRVREFIHFAAAHFQRLQHD